MGSDKIKVLVVDDSLLFRSLLSNILKDDDGIDVVGTAMNGRAALSAIPQTRPDVITLDVEMPEMDGLTALQHIREKFPEIQVIMVSATTFEGAGNTIRAMELGAYDFFLKAGDLSSSAPDDKLKYVKTSILSKIKSAYRDRKVTEVSFAQPELATGTTRQEIVTQNLIIPGKRPLCFNMACEESYLGHLLLLSRNLKKLLNTPIIFKIMVPEVFLNSLIDSFKRNNDQYNYKVGIPDSRLKPNTVYLLGENHEAQILNSDGELHGSCKESPTRYTLNQHFEKLQNAKMQHTPIILISNNTLGDGISCLQQLTESGFPTVLATKCQDRFQANLTGTANMVLDINLLPPLIEKLFI